MLLPPPLVPAERSLTTAEQQCIAEHPELTAVLKGEIKKLHIHHEQDPEPFSVNGMPNKTQLLELAEACADRDKTEAAAK